MVRSRCFALAPDGRRQSLDWQRAPNTAHFLQLSPSAKPDGQCSPRGSRRARCACTLPPSPPFSRPASARSPNCHACRASSTSSLLRSNCSSRTTLTFCLLWVRSASFPDSHRRRSGTPPLAHPRHRSARAPVTMCSLLRAACVDEQQCRSMTALVAGCTTGPASALGAAEYAAVNL